MFDCTIDIYSFLGLKLIRHGCINLYGYSKLREVGGPAGPVSGIKHKPSY